MLKNKGPSGPHLFNTVDTYFAKRGLVDPDVRIGVIKKDTLFEIDGFRFALSARKSNSIEFKNSEQLVLSLQNHNYCKSIYKYCDDKAKNGRSSLGAEDCGITAEFNLSLYDELLDKMEHSKYNQSPSMTSLRTIISKGRSTFENLPLGAQTDCLEGLLAVFQCKPARVDLSMIGGSKESGRILMSKNITNSNISIIDLSPTGLFEKKMGLSKI